MTLPSQLRTYYEEWSRIQRVKESNKKAKPGVDVLNELNRVITPLAQNDDNQLLWKEPKAVGPLLPPPPQALRDTADVAVIGGFSIGNNAPLCSDATQPERRRRCGICRDHTCKGRGGRRYCKLLGQSLPKKRQLPKKRMLPQDVVEGGIDSQNYKKRQCQLCVMYGQGRHPNCIIGNGNRKLCKYYHCDGTSK